MATDPLARLEAIRSDPQDLGSIDIGMLLEAWEFEPTELPWSHGRARTLWRHPRDPERFRVVIDLRDRLSPDTVHYVIGLVDDLKAEQDSPDTG